MGAFSAIYERPYLSKNLTKEVIQRYFLHFIDTHFLIENDYHYK